VWVDILPEPFFLSAFVSYYLPGLADLLNVTQVIETR